MALLSSPPCRRLLPSFCLLLLQLLCSTPALADSNANLDPEYFLPCVNGPGEDDEPTTSAFPSTVTLRAAVLTNTVPLAWYEEADENSTDVPFAAYKGFQPDLMRRLIQTAKEYDNITLEWQLEQAPPFSYGKQFEYMANDCNSTSNRRGGFPYEDCVKYDLIIGDYYGYPARSIKTLLTPPLLTTAAATVLYTERQKRQITTLQEAVALQEPVCLLNESHYDDQAVERFPGLKVNWCSTHGECLTALKKDDCCLFVEDKLQLQYLAVQDAQLQVTRQTFDEQYILWPINARLSPIIQQLVIRWIYEAKVNGTLDELYDEYFNVDFCPLGSAGPNCELPCSSAHGSSDRYGTCVCESTKWTGDDCATEVQEDRNLIPNSLKIISYVMVGINFTAVLICGIWLFIYRNTTQVKVSQPYFLFLILVGCLISTSTIFALAQEDDGPDDDVPGCMAIPWLYSVGFSITFGSLFAKIRRVFILFRAAEKAQYDNDVPATMITSQETCSIVTAIVAMDVTILTIWTIIDPLTWNRQITSMDKYGEPLSSEGYCDGDNWIVFASMIAALHLSLMLLATYMCYRSRNIPTQFHEGRYLSIAMVSNLQIFVIGVPVLVILGSDPQSSFFVRSAIIWMNDLVVVTVIFGNIMYSHYKEARIEAAARANYQIKQRAQEQYQEQQQQEGTKTLVSNMLLQS